MVHEDFSVNQASRGIRWLRLGALAAALLAGPAAPVLARAESPEPPAVTPAQASAALDDAVAALSSSDPDAAHPTVELLELAQALPALEGAERRQARAILARPPDGVKAEPYGAGWTASETETRRHKDFKDDESEVTLRVHWVRVGPDAPPGASRDDPADFVPPYVEKVGAFAIESARVQNDLLAWPQARPDEGRGGSDAVDIYLSNLGPRIFGYAVAEGPGSTCDRSGPGRCFGYMVLDNDYSRAEFGYREPDIPLQVTMAHEYNHLLQFGIDTRLDPWMLESTATWVEEHVFPDADDWLFFVNGANGWARQPAAPITRVTQRMYGTAVWNHWLEAVRGPGTVLAAWHSSRKGAPKHFAARAYERAIKAAGGRSFAHEFGRFAAATAEWRATTSAFPDREKLGEVRRQGELRPGGRARLIRLNHAAYRLLQVSAGSADRLRLRVRAPRGVQSTIALVARTGRRTSGTAHFKHRYLPRGGVQTLALKDPADYARITAVVVNGDIRLRGRDTFGFWNYARDDAWFRVAVR